MHYLTFSSGTDAGEALGLEVGFPEVVAEAAAAAPPAESEFDAPALVDSSQTERRGE